MSSLLRQQINFGVPIGMEGWLIVAAWGTDSGAGTKGVALTDDTGTVLVEHTWAGAAEQVRVGAFTTITEDDDLLCRLYAKGATAAETLIIHQVAVEFRFQSGQGVG